MISYTHYRFMKICNGINEYKWMQSRFHTYNIDYPATNLKLIQIPIELNSSSKQTQIIWFHAQINTPNLDYLNKFETSSPTIILD